MSWRSMACGSADVRVMCQGRIRRKCRGSGLRDSVLKKLGAQEGGECPVGFFGYAKSAPVLRLEGGREYRTYSSESAARRAAFSSWFWMVLKASSRRESN